MEEQIIEFETAQLAKEKGYDIKSIKSYSDLGIGGIPSYRLVHYNAEGSINAPTQSLLQRWLREIHNIHIEPSLSDLEPYWDVALYEIRPEPRWLIIGQRQIPSYEEAIEVGLIKALKLIK